MDSHTGPKGRQGSNPVPSKGWDRNPTAVTTLSAHDHTEMNETSGDAQTDMPHPRHVGGVRGKGNNSSPIPPDSIHVPNLTRKLRKEGQRGDVVPLLPNGES